MRAVVMRSFGEPAVLSVEQASIPTPSPGDVLVRVGAVEVSPTRDVATRIGTHPFSAKISLPHVLGGDFAGVVADVGFGVDRALIGRRVAVRGARYCRSCSACHAGLDHQCADVRMLGIDLWGSYAEYVCAPAENLHPFPDTIDMVEAAALAATGPIALAQWYSAGLKAGSTVLITGITGALATTLATLAVALGARVIGLSRRPEAVPATLGVVTLDSGRDDLTDALTEVAGENGLTAVIDNVADPATFDRYFRALAPGAQVVISGAISSTQLPVLRVPALALYLRSITLQGIRTASNSVVRDFWEKVNENKFRLPSSVIHEGKLDSAAQVHAEITAGRTVGHRVLRVSEDDR